MDGGAPKGGPPFFSIECPQVDEHRKQKEIGVTDEPSSGPRKLSSTPFEKIQPFSPEFRRGLIRKPSYSTETSSASKISALFGGIALGRPRLP